MVYLQKVCPSSIPFILMLMTSVVPLINVKSRDLPVQLSGSIFLIQEASAPSSLLPQSHQSGITGTSRCIGLVGDFSDISISVRRGGGRLECCGCGDSWPCSVFCKPQWLYVSCRSLSAHWHAGHSPGNPLHFKPPLSSMPKVDF